MTATTTTEHDAPLRFRIPADLGTPDRLLAGLTARQLALLAPPALLLYVLWHMLPGRVPLSVVAVLAAPVAAAAVTVALGRRDGVGLDAWLTAAVTHRLRPRRLAPGPAKAGPPEGQGAPAALRLPAKAISDAGIITSTGPGFGSGSAVAIVAASTVPVPLQTPGEQAALVAGYARWLNSLNGPVQVVVSARRVDVGARAQRVAENAHRLPDALLAQAAIGHAEHLLDLCEGAEPLTRTVSIACTASPVPAGAGAAGSAEGEALRRAERTAAALGAVGSRCRVLHGGEVTAVLAAAVDPWGPGDAGWPRTPPGGTVTGPPVSHGDEELR